MRLKTIDRVVVGATLALAFTVGGLLACAAHGAEPTLAERRAERAAKARAAREAKLAAMTDEERAEWKLAHTELTAAEKRVLAYRMIRHRRAAERNGMNRAEQARFLQRKNVEEKRDIIRQREAKPLEIKMEK